MLKHCLTEINLPFKKFHNAIYDILLPSHLLNYYIRLKFYLFDSLP